MTKPDEDLVYPVDIYMTAWLRIACAAFFGAMILISVIAGLFSLAGSQDPGTLFAMGLCVLVFTPLLWIALTGKFTLWPDRIESFNGFRTRALRRAEIEGFRHVEDSDSIRLDVKDELLRGMTLPSHVQRDPSAIVWLAGIADLDAAGRLAEQAAIDADPGLGANVQDRRATVRAMRRLELPLEWIGLGTGLWAMIYPHPYLWAIGCAALIPIFGLAVHFGLGRYYRLDRASTDPRPVSQSLYLMGPMALCLRAFVDVSLIDWQAALGYAALLSALLIGLAAWIGRGERDTKLWLGAYLLFALAYAYGCVVEADVQFDDAKPAIYSASVRNKTVTHGDSTTYSVDVTSWGPDKRSSEIDVGREFYDAVKAGQKICLYVQPGWLHIRWYYPDFC